MACLEDTAVLAETEAQVAMAVKVVWVVVVPVAWYESPHPSSNLYRRSPWMFEVATRIVAGPL
jgi:hypothetical protein